MATKKPAAKGGGVLPGTTKFVYDTSPAKKSPTTGAIVGGLTAAMPAQSTAAPTPAAPSASGTTSAADAYYAWLKQQQAEAQAAQLAQQQAAAIGAIKAQFSAFGLGSLAGKIEEYIKKGYDSNTAYLMLTQTAEYKARFPAMAALAAQGRSITEAEYIGYEQTAAQTEREFGLPSGMLTGNVTEMLTKNISASEFRQRATLAASDALTAPQDLKDQMANYYGLDQGALTAYYLDPDIALPLLEKQAAAARIGVQGTRQGLDINLGWAENLQGRGISEAAAGQGFATVAGLQGLESGRGETVSQDNLISGVFGDAADQQKIARVQGSRTGRFESGGGFATDRSGYAGLGGATR